MKLKSRIYFNNDDVLTMCYNLEYEAAKVNPELIVGIKRGGLVPAVHLSHALSRPMEVLTWQTRDDKRQDHNAMIQDVLDQGGKVLFIDDINDTGKTIKTIREHYNNDNCIFMTMVEKTTSEIRVDATALRFDDERWVVFPWEKV